MCLGYLFLKLAVLLEFLLAFKKNLVKSGLVLNLMFHLTSFLQLLEE